MRAAKIILWLIVSPFILPLVALLSLRLFRWGELKWVWRSLQVAPGTDHFCEAMVAHLPPLVQRYFLHSIQPGARLVTSAQSWGSGITEDRPGAVVSNFEEHRILTPHRGGGWKAYGKHEDHSVVYTYYHQRQGLECSFLFHLIPVYLTRYNHADITRTFRNRMIFEMILLPSTLLPQHGVTWEQLDDENIRATVVCDGETFPLTLRIGENGKLLAATFDYWNVKRAGRVYRKIPCAQIVHEERTIDGYTIPSKYTLEFWHNSNENDPGPIYHFTIDRIHIS